MSFWGYQDYSYDMATAHVAQLVEHILGKDEVISSILIMGSKPFEMFESEVNNRQP